MKIGIVTMAKDEDPYIDEWLDYHYKLGVDGVWLIQHGGWRYVGPDYPNLHLSTAPQEAKQRDVLNHGLAEWRHAYDWLLFTDIDEFVCLKNGDNNLKDFLARYDDCNGICFNWRMFGDSFLIDDGDRRVVERFTWCEKRLSPWVKQALHCSKAGDNVWLADVHSLMRGYDIRVKINLLENCVNVSKRHCQTALGYSDEDLDECRDIAWIAHYKTKTYGEWERRIRRNNEYFYHGGHSDNLTDVLIKFADENCNDVEDLSLRNFQRTGRFA